jgi:hypothetical protein
MAPTTEPASFRDPAGFIFYREDKVYRAVNFSYKDDYTSLIQSGLYQALVDKGWLIPHEEVSEDSLGGNPFPGQPVFKFLHVATIPFISYPYEWCFSQLKEAALLTLNIQLLALEHGMTLKDSSSFNVQFYQGKPVFIDSLSFTAYEEGKPWVAYRQFCTHFLAPLALISKISPHLRGMLQLYPEGIPLMLASKLLKKKTKWSPFFQMHVHYHAKLENKYSGDTKASAKIKYNLSKTRLAAIIKHLQSGVSALQMDVSKTEWSDYYQEFSYSDEAFAYKKELIKKWASELPAGITWDLGSNTGVFSKLVQPYARQVVAFDIDYLAVEKFYLSLKNDEVKNILPLVQDLGNPTPAIGWSNRERKSLTQRGPADLVLALALVHHVCIGNNVPFLKFAEYLSGLTKYLIIEFVPKHDPQAQRLLVTREDVFQDYQQPVFEAAFGSCFRIDKRQELTGTERTLYLMTRHDEIAEKISLS